MMKSFKLHGGANADFKPMRDHSRHRHDRRISLLRRGSISAALAAAAALGLLTLGNPALSDSGPGTPGHVSYTANPLAGSISNPPPGQPKPVPIAPQTVPDVMLSPQDETLLQQTPWAQNILIHQWNPTEEIPAETILSQSYMRSRDSTVQSLTLKDAIFIALRNNPGIASASLEPLASLQTVRQNYAVFDPNLSSLLDIDKSAAPSTSILTSGGAQNITTKNYDWDFAISKVLATTNGTLSATFDNNRNSTSSPYAAVSPAYTPSIYLSLDQPLLRNFGDQFATINVRISQAQQKQAQYTYEQQLNDFVLQVGSDYWNVVRAEENLEVANRALVVAQDLVHQNLISVQVGVLAPLSLREAQSEAATDQANVYTAQGQVDTARAQLREDVMYNPHGTFLPAQLEPSERPHPQQMPEDEERSLELAMMYRPELAAMREQIRSLLLQVKYAENQILPQFNVGAQFGLTSVAGAVNCNTTGIGSTTPAGGIPCTNPNAVPTPAVGVELPFKGLYPEALDRMWRFSFYNYAVVFSIQRPFSNDAAKAALAQAKIGYEQQRLTYRNTIAQVVVDVQQSLANLEANYKAAEAARTATDFAAASLHDERERFRVGMATTHELLQFIDSLVAAEGNQVQAEVNFEIAKLSVKHAEGTLLRNFNVNFVPNNPDVKPWYAHF